MTVFWIVATFMALSALVFILWPIIQRKDDASAEVDRKGLVLDVYNDNCATLEAQFEKGEISEAQREQLLAELNKTLLEDSSAEEARMKRSAAMPWVLGVSAAFFLVFCVQYYQKHSGMPDVEIQQLMQKRVENWREAIHNNTPPDLSITENLIVALEKRVENTSGDQFDNRYMLAQLYSEMGRYEEAAVQYRLLLAEVGEPDPGIQTDLAEAIYFANGNKFTPEASMLLESSLQLAPMMPKSHSLAAVEAYNNGEFNKAIKHWRSAMHSFSPDSPVAKQYQANIDRAQAQIDEYNRQVALENGESIDDQTAAGGEPQTAEPAQLASVTVSVRLKDGINVPASTPLLIYARAWQGPKMPLAIQRMTVGDLPVTVKLDDTMAMLPGMNISSFPQIELVARVSFSGGAVPQSGDWLGTFGPVVPAEVTDTLQVEVSQQIP